MGSLPPEVEVLAAFRFVLRMDASTYSSEASFCFPTKTGLKGGLKVLLVAFFTLFSASRLALLLGCASNKAACPSTNSASKVTFRCGARSRNWDRTISLETSSLVQFGAHRGLQGSHIGGHIVYFHNVWEDGDEAMGPVTGLVCRRVSGEGSQSGVGGVYRDTAESVGTVAQGASSTHRDRAH